MKQYFITMLFALGAAFANVAIPLPAHAQSGASVALSILPGASAHAGRSCEQAKPIAATVVKGIRSHRDGDR